MEHEFSVSYHRWVDRPENPIFVRDRLLDGEPTQIKIQDESFTSALAKLIRVLEQLLKQRGLFFPDWECAISFTNTTISSPIVLKIEKN